MNKKERILAIRNSIKNVKDSLGEEGKELVATLEGILTELENQPEEVSKEDLLAEIQKVIDAAKLAKETEVTELAEKIAKLGAQGKAVFDKAEAHRKITEAVIGANSHTELNERIKKVVESITGMPASQIVDYVISNAWGDASELWKAIKKTKFTTFLYSPQLIKTAKASILAHQWAKESEVEKKVQEILAQAKQIKTKYVYKRQNVAQEDLDEVAENGTQAEFIEFLTKELVTLTSISIEIAILVGDNMNEGEDKITTFESIGTKTKTDLFTIVAEAPALTYTDLWKLVNNIAARSRSKLWVYVESTELESLCEFKYTKEGTPDYRSLQEIADRLGVAKVISYDLQAYGAEGVHAVMLDPSEYWCKIKKEQALAYAHWEVNEKNWQYEANTGGAVHGLLSSGVLRTAGVPAAAKAAKA